MSQVGLESEGFWHRDFFEKIEHVSPAMHARPADFPFGSQSFPVGGGDFGGFAEGFSDASRARLLTLTPFFHPMFRRIDPNHSVFPNSVLVEDPGDATGNFDGVQELLAARIVTHGRVTHRSSQTGATSEPTLKP